MSDYNGWTNRETWLVNVWYNPESVRDVDFAKYNLEEQIQRMPSGPLKDMIDLDIVNWSELYEAMEDYIQED